MSYQNLIEILETLKNIPDDFINIIEYIKNKEVTYVYRNIQLDNYNIKTFDVKLYPYKEDKLYKNDTLRYLIPRGCCFIFINDVFIQGLYGHPKFGYIYDYVPKQKNDIDKLIFRNKENGECCHWSGFMYDSQYFEIIGSKNVHLIVRTNNYKEDLKIYTEERYNYAKEIALQIRNEIKDNQDNLIKILDYFDKTKYTFCGESCNLKHQHLVKYDINQIYFFAVTGKRINENDSLVKLNPLEIDGFFRNYGLKPVLETIIIDIKQNPEKLNEIENYYETKLNNEGSVVYQLDNENKVIFAYKHKNIDYVYKRALREVMRNNGDDMSVITRFNQKHVIHPEIEEITKWSLRFNAYYHSLENI